MSEPLHNLSTQPAPDQTPDSKAVDTALDKASDLPFFDLDIALIRRGQQSPAVQPSAAKPATLPVKAPAPEFTRERKALDALEALLAERAAVRPVPAVAQFPKAAPIATPIAPAAKAEPKSIEPRVMPVSQQSQSAASFVSPGFERVTVAAPATEAGEPLAALATALLQTASDVTAHAADLLPELKLQMVRQAITRRETRLFATQPVAAPAQWQPTPPPVVTPAMPAPQAEAEVSADDLPWGHVTYRLMVM